MGSAFRGESMITMLLDCLIQVSSRNAISPHAHLPTYGTAKAALNNVTLSLSKEFPGHALAAGGIGGR
jgi:3-oxoacyl-[acyl-carrier protein] reductase